MTTPYVTGTVSVTAGSAIVTGVGTGWLTSGLVAGQFGLDSANGNPVPVLSIDSDTQITLAKPWRGTTASAQGYWITYDTTPGQQTVANAQMLALYLSRLDKPALAALASLTPAADKLPYFGAQGAGALADFNAAARALLAGGVLPNGQLPTRLQVKAPYVANLNNVTDGGWCVTDPNTVGTPKQGYFGVLTIPFSDATSATQLAYPTLGEASAFRRHRANNVWGAWMVAGSATLGQVYNAGGISSGAIIERGSNVNGEYVRFADGTQICWRRMPLAYYSAQLFSSTWTFPVAFSVAPSVTIGNTIDFNGGAIRYDKMYTRTDAVSAVAAVITADNVSVNNVSGDVYRPDVIATGRWF